MFIFVEGCDASGKSTLIEELKKRLNNYQVVKGSSFEHSQCTQDELYKKFDGMIMTDEGNVIFDRFIYSNYVYASLYDDYAMLSAEQRSYLEFIVNHMSVIIYLYASPETLTERLNTRGDDYVKAERIPAILQKYNEVLFTVDSDIPILSFDTEAMTTEQIADHIVEFEKSHYEKYNL